MTRQVAVTAPPITVPRIPISLIRHQWLSSFRSVVRPQNVAGTVILSILLVILALNLLSLGLLLERLLAERGQEIDAVAVVNGFLGYYFVLDLLLRLWFQRVPGQIVRPYLFLPVRRSTLVRLLLTKSFLTLFNILPLLLFVPIALRVVAPRYGIQPAAAWTLFLLLLLLCNGMATLYVKKRELTTPWMGALVLAVVMVIAALDYLQLLPLRLGSAYLFGQVLAEPWLVVIPLLLLVVLYRATSGLLTGHLTVESLQDPGAASGGRFSFRRVEELGPAGRLIALELKMLLRNRRPRSVIIFGASMIPFLMAFEAYWLASVPDRSDIYPAPDSLVLQQARAGESDPASAPQLKRVRFVLQPRTVPEDTWVYVTGNLPRLGMWNPAAIPLLPQRDGSWRRTVMVPADTLIEFRFTLGSWDAQRLPADGSRPANSTLHVERDTTVTMSAERWRSPEIFVLVHVNMIYIGILLSGMFLLSYGQLLIGWEGGYLEGLLARKVSLPRYLGSKYAILVGSIVCSFVLTLPLGLLKPWFIPINGALALYNMGVNTIILLMVAQFSKKPVDLNASLFSMQGKGSVQVLVLAPVMLGPLLVYGCCALLGVAAWTFWFLGGLGVLGLALYPLLMRHIVRLLIHRKHMIVAAYRLA